MRHMLLAAALLFYGAQSIEPAADFAIRFDHKGCHYEYLDTFKGTYSHIGAAAPVSFALSDEQRRTLLRAIMAARFFDLPAITYSGNGGDPADKYELAVRNAGRLHSVSWSVDSEWYQSEAGRSVLELNHTIFEILRTHPDVQRLPQRGDGCAGGPPTVR